MPGLTKRMTRRSTLPLATEIFSSRLEQAVVDILPFPKVGFDARLGIGLAFGVVQIPEAGNPALTKSGSLSSSISLETFASGASS